jgi:hypothetical protein
VGAGLAQRGLRGGDVLALAVSTAALAACRLVAASSLGLGAHDALLGQRNGAAGVGLLVVVVGLRLGQRSLRGLHLRLGVDGGAAGLAAVWRSVSTVSPA